MEDKLTPWGATNKYSRCRQAFKCDHQLHLVFLAIRPTRGWSVVAVPAWAGLVLLEPPSVCRRLFDDEVAGAGLELLLELARLGFEPRSPAAGVYAHN